MSGVVRLVHEDGTRSRWTRNLPDEPDRAAWDRLVKGSRIRLSSHAYKLLGGIESRRRGSELSTVGATDPELAEATGLSVHQVRRAFPEVEAAGYCKRSGKGPARKILILYSLAGREAEAHRQAKARRLDPIQMELPIRADDGPDSDISLTCAPARKNLRAEAESSDTSLTCAPEVQLARRRSRTCAPARKFDTSLQYARDETVLDSEREENVNVNVARAPTPGGAGDGDEDAAGLIRRFRGLGYSVFLKGKDRDSVGYELPDGGTKASPELVAALKARKPEVVAALKADPEGGLADALARVAGGVSAGPPLGELRTAVLIGRAAEGDRASAELAAERLVAEFRDGHSADYHRRVMSELASGLIGADAVIEGYRRACGCATPESARKVFTDFVQQARAGRAGA